MNNVNQRIIRVGLLTILWLLSSCGATQKPTRSEARPMPQLEASRAPASPVPTEEVMPSATATSPIPTAQMIAVGVGSYRRIPVSQFADMLLHKDFVLVNTHIPYIGEIAATDIFLAYDQIGQQLGQLPADKQAKIVLYCRTGHMSAIAAETLVNTGYTNVWDVEGGMVAWQKSGQSLISK